MNPSLASLICYCGIAGLFYLGRDRSVRTSRALWLPVVYIWIIGSRPVSVWLGIGPPSGANVQLDGSPFDALVFGLLLASAVIVLIRRSKQVLTLCVANWPILIYFTYCLISISWAYYPDVAFKRWLKAIGDLAMVLVIVTDSQPVAALRRLFSRVGFLLLPTSVLFIKYYGDLGRGYTPDGLPMNTGVTTNKNSLGLIVLVVALGTLWHVRALLLDKKAPNRTRRLLAHGILLAFALSLFQMADSATSTACFILGGGLILATNLRAIRRPARVHALCLTTLLAGGIALLFAGEAGVAGALGRNSNLSGRTEIWAAVISAVPNRIVGTGFENFWIGPDVQKVWRSLSGWWDPTGLNEAHNGYIEIYANLGWIGVSLIALVVISGYRRAYTSFHRDPEIGSLFLAYIASEVIYSITEAGFRTMMLSWIFFLLGMVGASAVANDLFGVKKRKIRPAYGGTTSTRDAIDEPLPAGETVYATPGGLSPI